MKITRVQATALTASFADLYGGVEKIPAWISRPTAHFQSITRAGQYSTLVIVEVEDGSIGFGEAWGLPLPEISAMVVNRLIAPYLVGRELEEMPKAWEELTLYFKRMGLTRGGTMEALSGVDIAVWDLLGKLQGKPVSQMIGTPQRHAIDCYASPIMFKPDIAESKKAAMEFIDAGYRAIKIKVGRAVPVDTAHVHAVRETVGPDVALMLDANGGFSAGDAIALARAVEECDITWLEEPVPSGQVRDYARIKGECGMRLAVGENDFTIEDFSSLLDFGHVDVVMPNVTRAGGITGVLQIAALAGTSGAEFSLHGVGSGLMQCASVHVLSVIPHARYFEVNTFPNPLRDRLALPVPQISGGSMLVPVGPGLGCSIDEHTVTAFKAA